MYSSKSLHEMHCSMNNKEKLWFLKKIKLSSYDLIIDFGCAKGEMLGIIDKLIPTYKRTVLIGLDQCIYDNYPKFNHSCTFLTDLDTIKPEYIKGMKILTIFSSVLHEVDYSTLKLWSLWVDQYATTVVCRDMFWAGLIGGISYNIENSLYLRLSTSTEFGRKMYEIRKRYKAACERPIMPKILYEFFLKYTYVDTWNREVKEMYLCNKAYDFCMLLGSFNKHDPYHPFDITYFKTYTLPFKKKAVREKFGYKMRFPTHIKFALQRKTERDIEN